MKNQVTESTRELQAANEKGKALRANAIAVIKESNPSADTNDTNYIFLTFVLHYLPHGLIGLLIAVVFCASWNSTTAELKFPRIHYRSGYLQAIGEEGRFRETLCDGIEVGNTCLGNLRHRCC